MEHPEVTIGTCAHNEEDTIGRLIEQVLEEDVPVKQFIVVVAGDDRTAEIVEEKSRENEFITLVEEDEREGQIAAQNKILERASGDAILLLDADGTIEPGSLEALYERFNGENAVSGKEVPVTAGSALGALISVYGDVHHEMCLDRPRFSTHIGIMPADLVERFPEIVLDDVYVEHRAQQEDLPIEYEPRAVKHHHMPNTLRFFFHQQKKNWAGRFQAEDQGYHHTKPESQLVRAFLEQLPRTRISRLPAMIALAAFEAATYTAAKIHQATGRFPVKWWRPR